MTTRMEVHVLHETSREWGGNNPRVFWTLVGARKAMRSVIEDYRQHSLVAPEIDGLLAEFDAGSEALGDSGALFYVEVFSTEIED